MPKLIDLSGKTFGKLKVVCRVENTKSKSQSRWKCVCDCGNEKIVQGCHLRNGHTNSCGCINLQYGTRHWSWKGYEEISARFFSTLQSNAKIRGHIFSITLKEMWELFVKQDKKCALSGLPLIFGANHGRVEGTASLDRIDSSKGYTIDNVQWVHKIVNLMKQDSSDKEFVEMCRIISNYNTHRINS